MSWPDFPPEGYERDLLDIRLRLVHCYGYHDSVRSRVGMGTKLVVWMVEECII